MGRQLAKLSPRMVASVEIPGRYGDVGGLYLIVDPSGAKRWTFIFRWRQTIGPRGPGRLREMGLGSFNSVPLARAREKAAEARRQIGDRVYPIAARRSNRAIPSFGEMADEHIATKTLELRSDKSLAKLKRILKVHAAPPTPLRVDAVDTDHILAVPKPLWTEKPETATTSRGYIEAVLDAARARGFREGENPARWRGHLSHLLQKPQKLKRGHHAAMPFTDVPEFIIEIRQREAVAALALEFLILTAARSGEVLGARWSEINLQTKVWTVPAERHCQRKISRPVPPPP